MSKNRETLEKLLEKGTHNECISFLSSLAEKERWIFVFLDFWCQAK